MSSMLVDWCYTGDLESWGREKMIGETAFNLDHDSEGHMDALARLSSGACDFIRWTHHTLSTPTLARLRPRLFISHHLPPRSRHVPYINFHLHFETSHIDDRMSIIDISTGSRSRCAVVMAPGQGTDVLLRELLREILRELHAHTRISNVATTTRVETSSSPTKLHEADRSLSLPLHGHVPAPTSLTAWAI